jgi:hypothetical protein
VLHYCQAFGWSFHQVVDWGWCEILASCWNNFSGLRLMWNPSFLLKQLLCWFRRKASHCSHNS